jgi:D-alanine-D-alanine ligase
VTYERKADYPFAANDAPDADSELLSAAEEQELLGGLRDAGHDVVSIGDAQSLLDRIDHWRDCCDLVFNRSVGYRGSERKSIVAAILEAAGIPYLGSSPYVLSLTRHKYHTKLAVRDAGILTPTAALVFGGTPERLDEIRYPAIVKPVAESSSIGIEAGASIVATPGAALRRAKILLERYSQPVLVESFVEGIEIEVPVIIDPQPRVLGLAVVAIDGQLPDKTHYLASDSVYNDNYSYLEPPAYVDTERVAEAAVRGTRALGIRDYGRLDFRVTADGTPWFIEASTHPHIQRHSSFFVTAQRQGMAYHELLDMLVQVAARRCGLFALDTTSALVRRSAWTIA